MSGFLKSSIGKKIAMALSAFFLMFFILQHFAINILSVINPDTFNEVSHFMGTNPVSAICTTTSAYFWGCFSFCNGICFRVQKQHPDR